MTIKRAIEILNPEHREHYDSIEIVEEACRMGMNALEKQIPKKPVEKTPWTYHCPNCDSKKVEEVFIERFRYCPDCGQALDWSDVDER